MVLVGTCQGKSGRPRCHREFPQLHPLQDIAVRQFLLTNLVEAGSRFVWRVNLDALAQHVDKILAFPVCQEAYPGPTLFLLGGNSNFVQ